MTQKEQLLQQYSNWLVMRNYSQQTYKAYMGSVRKFWSFCEARRKEVGFDKNNAVQTYLAYRLKVEKRDFSTVNGDYSALQWFYKYVLDREWNVRKLIRPKKEKRLPRYLTPQQVCDLLDAVTSEKHRLMMLVYYATGMRLSEVRLLLWEDVNFEEGIIHVKKGKGAKDRIVILPQGLAGKMQEFRTMQRTTQQFVFEGKTPGSPIAARTIQWGFIRARQKAGLPKWVTAHVLRHSFATASNRNGADLLILNKLLGHKKLSTTSRYLHLNVQHLKKAYNPLDNPCLNAHLQPRKNPDTPSGKSFDNLEENLSKNINRVIG